MNCDASLRWLLVLLVIFPVTGCALNSGNTSDRYEDILHHVRSLDRRIQTLEARESRMVDVLARARGAVSYVWGTYTFVDYQGLPLRYVVNELGEPVADPRGTPQVDVKGQGPIAVKNYCGTAFLVASDGKMLTNRHVAEPWWEDEESAPLLAAGLKPVFLRLRAFFQERVEGVPIEVLRIDERRDIALVKPLGWVPVAPPLTLKPDPDDPEEGQPVLLIGYPTGLEAILAKMEDPERTDTEQQTGPCSYETAERLSRRKQLRPTVTSGFLWEALSHILVYDARTMGGGSGGPLLDWSGNVVGVNYAYLEQFQGGNYGVPIRYGKQLLQSGGIAPHGPIKECSELLAAYEGEQEKNITSCSGKKGSP